MKDFSNYSLSVVVFEQSKILLSVAFSYEHSRLNYNLRELVVSKPTAKIVGFHYAVII